jgi:hypothetical protein
LLSNSYHVKTNSLPDIKSLTSLGVSHNSNTNYNNYNGKGSTTSLAEKSKLLLSKKVLANGNTKFYCPFCQHCNQMNDDNLEQNIIILRESKNILTKGLEFIVNNDYISKGNADLIFENNNDGDNTGNTNINGNGNIPVSDNSSSMEQKSLEYVSHNSNDKFTIENLLNFYPKQTNYSASNYRSTYQILAHFLNALIDDKVAIETLISAELAEKINKSLISKGVVFDEAKGEVFFDEELEDLFDGRTKEVIKTLFRSTYISNLFYFRKVPHFTTRFKNSKRKEII